MRIVTGKYKGKAFVMPKGIRPTQQKVRKALFDILGDIEGLSMLELYAGSGAIGFEALSRGLKELALVEYNRDCFLAINKNIESLKLKACSVYPMEADKAIARLAGEKRVFDLVFFDPPYYQGLAKKTLQTLAAYDIVAPQGLVVVQHFKKDDLPENLGVFSLFRTAKYGDTALSFYRKKG